MFGLALVLSVALASAGEPSYLEAAGLPERKGAVRALTAAGELGVSGRIERRYEHGLGWTYAVVLTDFPVGASVDGIGGDLTRLVGVSFTSFGGESAPVDSRSARVPPSHLDDIVARAVATRRDAVERLKAARGYDFVFVRTVGGRPISHHVQRGSAGWSLTFASDEGSTRLEVTSTGGLLSHAGVSYSRLADDLEPWLRMVSPAQLVGRALLQADLPRDTPVEVSHAADGLVSVSSTGALGPAQRWLIDPRLAVIRSVERGGPDGRTVIHFADFRRVGAAWIPFRLSVSAATGVVDEVTIERLILDGGL